MKAKRNSDTKPGEKGNFRDFLERRRAKAGRGPVYEKPDEPTPERIAKGDQLKKTTGGFYRAPPPIERLRDRNALDGDPKVAAAMMTAASTLYADFYAAGLNGVQAQDLSREIRGGGSNSASFPRTERAMHHRRRFRDAVERMGWFPDHPHRGAARITVEVCCYELAVSDAARLYVDKGRRETALASAMDRLREGLFILAKHWRLI